MKIYRLPPAINALVFDMDLTLYTHDEYGQYQLDCVIEKFAKIRGVPFNELYREIEDKRKTMTETLGRNPGLGNVLATYGVGIEDIVRWREELLEPAMFLKRDPRLRGTLEQLSHSFVLGVVTNNPVLVARKTFDALGVSGLFTVVVGIDCCMVSKPHRKPFEKFAELSGCPPETCVSIGDRYDIDLAIPLELGMGGILVDGVEDVYGLPEIVRSR